MATVFVVAGPKELAKSDDGIKTVMWKTGRSRMLSKFKDDWFVTLDDWAIVILQKKMSEVVGKISNIQLGFDYYRTCLLIFGSQVRSSKW